MSHFTTVTDIAQMTWDSEKRNSPYSTVCDPSDDTYCEACDQDIDYSDGSKHGRCGCDDQHVETDEEYAAAMAALGYKVK